MKTNKLMICSLWVTLAWLPGILSAKTAYYVSAQNGNDSWSGVLASPNSNNTDGPFKTLARAQASMRASSTVKTVNVRTGTYSIASSWQFNLTDSGETWISYPGEGPVIDGGGKGVINVPNSTYINQLTFEGLTFQNMGADGLNINFGKNLTIRWNRFYNCYQSCMNLAGLTNSIIDSNTLIGQSPGNPPGTVDIAFAAITLYYGSSNNQITHNLIQNCQGGGIALAAGENNPPNSNNLIDRNILKNVNTNVVDEGAIYMYDKTHSATGNQITNNIIDGNGGTTYLSNQTKAIYLDSGNTGVLVSGNICRSCGQFGWQIHAGDHNTIVNNVFDLSSPGTMLGIYQTDPHWTDYGMAGNVFRGNIIYFAGATPADLYQVNINSKDAKPIVSDNLYYSESGKSIPNGDTMRDANPIYDNPRFLRPSTGDYSMPLSSPAYNSIRFKPLVTDQGPLPYNPEAPQSLP